MTKSKKQKVVSKIGDSKKVKAAKKAVIQTSKKITAKVTKQFKDEPGIFKRSYRAIRNFLFGRKSPYENVLQYLLRQLLFPDSRGKPSLTATFFVWIMVIITYLTWIACGIAIDPVTITKEGGEIINTYFGFSDALIYLYIVIVGFLGYLFSKRENREVEQGAEMPAAGGNLLTTVIDSAKRLISK